MNSKTFKKIRKKTNAILFEWLQTLVSEEEFKKIKRGPNMDGNPNLPH